MLRKLIGVLLVAGALGLTMPAVQAEDGKLDVVLDKVKSLAADGKAREALNTLYPVLFELWGRTPLFVKRGVLVQEKAQGYGLYTPRGDAVYRTGQPILIYLEPAGYGFRQKNNAFQFGFAVDFAIRGVGGSILAAKKEFMNYGFTSRVPNMETFLGLSLELTGLPAGKYAVELTVHDRVSGEGAVVTFNIEIAA